MADTAVEIETPPVEEEIEIIETPDGLPPADTGAQDDAAGDNGEDDGEDERLGSNEEEPEKPRRQRMSNRDRRALKKQAEASLRLEAEELRQFKKAVIDNQVFERLAALEGNALATNHLTFDQRLQQARNTASQAEQVYAAAIEQGNGVDAFKAQQIYAQAANEIAALEPVVQNLQQARNAPPAPTPVLQQPQMNPLEKLWRESNDWYTDDPNDGNSNVARMLSAQIAQQGTLPNTIEHWREVSRRLNEMSQAPQVVEAAPAQGRKGPPVSAQRSGNTVAGKQQVYLPADLVSAMKEAGAWDDIPKRNRIIKGYQEERRTADAAQQGGR